MGGQRQHLQHAVQAFFGLTTGRQFLQHPGAQKDQGRTQNGGKQGHGQAVAPGQPAATVHIVEVVGLQGQAQVVRPELDQGRPDRHAHNAQNGQGYQYQNESEVTVALTVWQRRVGTERALSLTAGTSTQMTVQKEGQHSGNQQQHANGRAFGKLQLTDHGFIGFHGQHVVGTAHHFGHTKVGDGQSKDQACGGKNGIAAGGQGYRQEATPGVGTHGAGSVIQTSIGQGQTGTENHQGVGEGVEGFAQHNAPEKP